MPKAKSSMLRLLWTLAALAVTVCIAPISASEQFPTSSSSSSSSSSCSAADTSAITCPAASSASSPLQPSRLQVLFVSIAIKGHAQPLLRIAKAMKQRGYRVAFATHESGREWVASHHVPFVSAGAFPISADDLRAKLKTMTWDSSTFRGILTMFNDIYVAAARPMFDQLLPQLQHAPPALIVMDIASIGAQDLAHKLHVPHMINSPSILFDLGAAPSYIPAWGTGFSVTGMSLWNRCLNILFPRLLSVALTPPFSQLNKMRYELELKPYRSQHELFKGARVLLNTAFGLEHPQPLSPLIEPVGPILPLDFNQSRLEIDAQLRSWLEKKASSASYTPVERSDGAAVVVYMNLGTMSYIDAWQSEALVEGLTMRADETQIKVLWVLPADQRNVLPANLPPNFKVKPPHLVSSLDVVAHAAVRVVVSHCGMVSAQEALVQGKPLLCIPFHVDQPDVAARVVDAGAGRLINKNMITAEQVHDAVVALLTDATYTRNATRVGRLLERAGGTRRAIEIIDATLRLGTRHLETIDLALPWHKTAMLDVYAVYAAMFCVLALLVRMQWLLLYYAVTETCRFVSSVVFGPPEASATKTASEPNSHHATPDPSTASSIATEDDESATATVDDEVQQLPVDGRDMEETRSN